MIGCGSDSSSATTPTIEQPTQAYTYRVPLQRNDGWQVTDLNALNIDELQFVELMNNVRNEQHGYKFIDSIAVVKGGQLIFDERIRTRLDFADDWAGNKDVELHILNSVTKSVTSALIGIAIDKGFIQGVDVKVYDFFDYKQPISNFTNKKENVTLKTG